MYNDFITNKLTGMDVCGTNTTNLKGNELRVLFLSLFWSIEVCEEKWDEDEMSENEAWLSGANSDSCWFSP